MTKKFGFYLSLLVLLGIIAIPTLGANNITVKDDVNYNIAATNDAGQMISNSTDSSVIIAKGTINRDDGSTRLKSKRIGINDAVRYNIANLGERDDATIMPTIAENDAGKHIAVMNQTATVPTADMDKIAEISPPNDAGYNIGATTV